MSCDVSFVDVRFSNDVLAVRRLTATI